MRYTSLILFVLLFFSVVLCAQPAEYKMTREEYVNKFKDDAVKEMLMHGVPASITLAQGILESGNGNSALAIYANNHFGIKCHEWTGMTYIHDDDISNECFRKYNSVLESFNDHSMFLKTRSRYAFLFDLKINDYKGWARGLKAAGYATDPRYADKLIEIIELYNLYELDKMSIMPMTKTEITVKDKQPDVTKTHTAKIMLNNNIKYVVAQQGDTYFTLAKQLDMGLWQLYKYNETAKSSTIKTGDIVYLQPKKRRSAQEFHTVKKGETMYLISQKYGIKLKHLYSKNYMNPGEEPKPGTSISLKKKRKS